MASLVKMGATLKCSLASPPGTANLVLAPTNRTTAEGASAANIMDHVPTTNIPTFGMCMAPTNPDVATATTAASGVLTPQPCVPVIPTPWAPGSPTVKIGGQAALNSTSQCNCTWQGVIKIIVPGTVKTNIP